MIEALMKASQLNLGNLIYKTLVEQGSDREYADQAADFAEMQGRAYCLNMLAELGVAG